MAKRRAAPEEERPQDTAPASDVSPMPAQGQPPQGEAPMPPASESAPNGEEKTPGKKAGKDQDTASTDPEQFDEEQWSQLERFYDNIMAGLYGGDTPEGQIGSAYMRLLTKHHPEGAPGTLANAAAQITASALKGNLKKGVLLDQAVVVVGAALVLDRLARIMEQLGVPLSDDEVAQAAHAMQEMLFERTADLQFWDSEALLGELEELVSNPKLLEEAAREVDPQGAEALEQIPEDLLAQAQWNMPKEPPSDAEQAPPQGGAPPAGGAQGAPGGGVPGAGGGMPAEGGGTPTPMPGGQQRALM